MQLAVKDLQDAIQYMHENKKYRRVSSWWTRCVTGAFMDFFYLFFSDPHSLERKCVR